MNHWAIFHAFRNCSSWAGYSFGLVGDSATLENHVAHEEIHDFIFSINNMVIAIKENISKSLYITDHSTELLLKDALSMAYMSLNNYMSISS